MAVIEWVNPAPIWPESPAKFSEASFKQPFLAEFDGDNFMPDFLSLMAGPTPAKLAEKAPATLENNRFKLFQPLHGRYYLATGSLVCRQFGVPDRAVALQNGEQVFYVLRRRIGTREQGWVPAGEGGSWQNLLDANGEALDLLPDEERQPAHGVPVEVPNISGLPGTQIRKVYYAYIPVSGQQKYHARMADPLATLKALPTPAGKRSEDARMTEAVLHILGSWQQLIVPPEPKPETSIIREASLYLILDLADYINRYLPDTYQAILNGTNLTGQQQDLLVELRGITIDKIVGNAAPVREKLVDAIKALKDDLGMVVGEIRPGREPENMPTKYDVTITRRDVPNTSQQVGIDYLDRGNIAGTTKGIFYARLEAALKSSGKDAVVPAEVADMIKVDPDAATGAASGAAVYYLRMVYLYDPDCPPVVSALSRPFTFAKTFDPDAPARHIHIELPDIRNMRRFKRGVGMQTTPDLRNLMERINTSLMDKDGSLGADMGWDIGMICSFSIQIIMLVAFIVMFIFLILLNIIFWWLPFLKICFPIPIPKKS